MDILTNFGVQPILLIAQVVNFLLLLFILKRFLYKPILKVLEERKQKIAESLKNAEEIDKKLEQITLEREERLKKASKEAESLLQEATKTAEKIVAEAHQKAALDNQRMMEKTQTQIQLEKAKLQQEMHAELVDLVAKALVKVTGEVTDEKSHKKMVERSLKEVQ